ncbi:MAG: hypothetical protein ACFE8N_16120 [Promethearchaeota archaeon]
MMSNIKKFEEEDNWIEIDLDLCQALGEYVNAYPAEVYEIIDGKVKVERSKK